MRFLSKLVLALLPLATLAAPSVALASVSAPTTTYYFSGDCTDCTGVGRGELVLSNYAPGNAITATNFVSFHYDGSNLVPGGFTITSLSFGVSGSVNDPLPQGENFTAYGTTNYFSSAADGSWRLGLTSDLVPDDFGTGGTYSAVAPATDVPEPISLSILAMGLVGSGLVRRRR